LSQAWAVKQ